MRPLQRTGGVLEADQPGTDDDEPACELDERRMLSESRTVRSSKSMPGGTKRLHADRDHDPLGCQPPVLAPDR